jgi:hypothetical protein
LSNAVLRKESVPFMANVLAALVLPEEANDAVVLFLDVSLKELECVKSVTLLLKHVDPAAASGIVNEGDPITKARESEYRHLMQIAVNVFKRRCRAVRSFRRERRAMVFAMNTGNADRSQGIVRVNLEANSKLMLQNLLNLVDSNVHKTSMPERTRQGLA